MAKKINITVPEQFYSELKKQAKLEGTTMAGFVRLQCQKGFNCKIKPIRIMDEDEKLDVICSTRITKAEYQIIQEKAEVAGLTVSRYLASSALGKEINVIKIDGQEEIKEISHLLSKMGANLNQLTILSHQGKIKTISLDETEAGVKKIWQLLDLLMQKIKADKD